MIRSVTPGDLWVLRRKPHHQVVLYDEAHLVRPPKPFWFALRCFLGGSGHDRAMLTFHDRGLRGFVQARGRHGRPEQDIAYLASYGAHKHRLPSDYDIWFRLLEHFCTEAGKRHVQRLYAAVWSDQVEMREILRQLTFQPYTRRVVLQLSGPDWDQGTRLAMMRTQSRHDAWAIHKLYGTVAPYVVQHAEARTPRTWTLPFARRWRRGRGWVFGPEDNLIAYLHSQSGPAGHVLGLLIHPNARDQAADVLRFGLTQVQDIKPIYLLLAEYQSELLAPAENLGFQPVGEQTLFLKRTTIPVRKSVLIPAFEPGLEPRITVPQISVPREEAHAYARATRTDQ